MKINKSHKTFGGFTHFAEHSSQETGTTMKFSSFIPEGEIKGCLIWLSGLTCTEENFITKAGAQRYLAEAQLMLVCPDTSPRGLNLPGEHDADDFGSGAGFYLDALSSDYRDHYRMYSYLVKELVPLIETQYPSVKQRLALFGHSMGGHGALVLGLRHPELFRSVSAFSPIAYPSACPWGQKAFQLYLGEDPKSWEKYDATALVKGGAKHPQPLLIDQGQEDPFLKKGQLLPEDLLHACESAGQKVDMRWREGYDHSYFYISSFIAEHIAFHAKYLKG